jgi:hypothetical protein
MPENWKYAALGMVTLLAITGLFTLKRAVLPDLSSSGTPPNLTSKAEQSMEKVRLRVRAENKEPIPNVSVEFAVSNGSSPQKLTDTGGYTDVEIPKGVSVDIYLKHRDYDPQNYTVNSEIEPGKTKEFTLRLRAKADSSAMPVLRASEPDYPSIDNDVALPIAKRDYVDGAPSSSNPLVERQTADPPVARQSPPSLVKQQSGAGQQQSGASQQQQQFGTSQQQQQSGTGQQQQQSGTGQQQQQSGTGQQQQQSGTGQQQQQSGTGQQQQQSGAGQQQQQSGAGQQQQ